MEKSGRGMDDNGAEPASGMHGIFQELTAKQHEVLRFVAENRTSKEIAYEIGVSVSAVNQRIESVRNRAGSPPRAELARAYRQYLQEQTAETAAEAAVDASEPEDIESLQDSAAIEQPALAIVDGGIEAGTMPDHSPVQQGPRVLPRAFDGEQAAVTRVAAMVVIAVGLLLVAMVGLGVARALSDLF
jgi:DNA-binding CsgD family transcriptional regulator